MFAIEVPSDHRIQLKCTNVTLSSPENFLQVILWLIKPKRFRFTDQIFLAEIQKFQTISETVIADPPAMNRVYTSTSEIIYLFSQFSNQDSFKCQWTTVMIPPLPTDNKCKYFVFNHFCHDYYFSLFFKFVGRKSRNLPVETFNR
jgi:hypothetical protein